MRRGWALPEAMAARSSPCRPETSPHTCPRPLLCHTCPRPPTGSCSPPTSQGSLIWPWFPTGTRPPLQKRPLPRPPYPSIPLHRPPRSLRTPPHHRAGRRAGRASHCCTVSRSSSGGSGSVPVGTPSRSREMSDCLASNPRKPGQL